MRLIRSVKHINRAGPKVRCVNVVGAIGRTQRQPFVYGIRPAVDLSDSQGAGVPSLDGSVFRGNDKECGISVWKLKIRRTVEDLAGWVPARSTVPLRDTYDESLFRSRSVVKRQPAGSIVG